MEELNMFQVKQIKYIKKLARDVKKHGWDPMDMKIECITCAVNEDHLSEAQPIIDFIEKHPNHKTWMTNHHFDMKEADTEPPEPPQLPLDEELSA